MITNLAPSPDLDLSPIAQCLRIAAQRGRELRRELWGRLDTVTLDQSMDPEDLEILRELEQQGG